MNSREQTESGSPLSGSDALKLLEIINMSLCCREEEDFKDLFTEMQTLFPFDFAGAISGRWENGNGLAIAHSINISFPEKWASEYLSKNYFNLDRGTEYLFRNYELCHWSLLTKMQELKYCGVPKEIIDLNMDFGVREGYFHGARPFEPGQEGCMFSFAGHSLEEDMRTDAILEHLVPHLQLAFSKILGKRRPDNGKVNISGREKEVLHWLKEGKSTWGISVILGISQNTVNFHVYNIMRKLGAMNRPQAVAIAAHLGLVDFC